MTSHLFKFIKRLLSIHKYPRYIADFYSQWILQNIWRSHGVILGRKIAWLGRPIMTVVKRSTISIGEESVFCSRSTQTALGVNHPVILRTLKPGAVLTIGKNARMSGVTICAAKEVRIGDRCVIGANTAIVDTDFHSLDPCVRSSPVDSAEAVSRPVLIGDDVFIGNNCMILKGVTIGSQAVIGSHSVVTKDVAAGAIVAGNPAVPVGAIRTKQNSK